ncbi:MAG: hypothetical protein WBC33_05935 [Conexibacter sp.]
MSRRLLVPAILAIASLSLPALAAGADPAALPTIERVHPLKAKIGGTLTIVGRHFIPGKRRNTVVFLRDGAPAIFLKASRASATRLKVELSSKLGTYLIGRNNGEKGPTRFRLRVLARRFGARFTPLKRSPTILPRPGDHGDDGSEGPAAPVCTLKSAKAAPQADADGDSLTNAREVQIKTDPCAADSDGDAIPDGYEYESALDLNLRALPYPGKRPYPNALDPSDSGTDYDGDGLTLADEHAAWVAFGGRTFPLNYSDGTQTSGGPVQVSLGGEWQDLNDDGFLTDDEKDVDGDGLTNWDEAHGRMSPGWWAAVWDTEKPYTVSFLQTVWLDRDSDGDGQLDGLDDVDHDGWANQDEVTRGPYWVQPFNPCLPDPESRACALHPPVKDPYPPFRPGDPTSPIPLPWP